MLRLVGGIRTNLLCSIRTRPQTLATTPLRFQAQPLDLPDTMAPAATPTTTTVCRASSRAATVAAGQQATQAASASASTSQPKTKRKATDTAPSAAPKNGSSEASQHSAVHVNGDGAATPAKKPRKKAVSDSDSPSAPKSEDTMADPSLPNNTEMPASLSYDRPSTSGSVRITSWNITSLKSSEPKGMMRYIEAEDADIVVLSETKVNDVPMHPGLTKLYKHQYWGIGKQKGYAGLAILSKIQPVKAVYGLPGLKDQDTKGRIGTSIPLLHPTGHCQAFTNLAFSRHLVAFNTVTLEFENSFLVGTYAVNAGEGLKVSGFSHLSPSTPRSTTPFALLGCAFSSISSAIIRWSSSAQPVHQSRQRESSLHNLSVRLFRRHSKPFLRPRA